MLGWFVFNAAFDYLHRNQRGCGSKAYVQLHESNLGHMLTEATREALKKHNSLPNE